MWLGEVLGNERKTYPLKKIWASLKSSWPISTLDGPWRTSTTWRLFWRWVADFCQSPVKKEKSGSRKELQSTMDEHLQGEESYMEGRAASTGRLRDNQLDEAGVMTKPPRQTCSHSRK